MAVFENMNVSLADLTSRASPWQEAGLAQRGGTCQDANGTENLALSLLYEKIYLP